MNHSPTLSPTIFRAYDIRGVYGRDFDAEGFAAIAYAFAQRTAERFGVESPTIFLSGDGRQSQSELVPAVVAGLVAGGAQVTWGGTLPTPINYFAQKRGNYDASVQVSASHNPPEYNGLKLTDRHGAVCGEAITQLGEVARAAEAIAVDYADWQAQTQAHDYAPAYSDALTVGVEHAPLHIIVDSGNSIAGSFYPSVLRKLGHTVTELYCELDTTFPHHQPDPEEPENLTDLVAAMAEHGADLGVAFDGDGDRVGIVLPGGEILSADQIMAGLTADFLTRNPNERVVVDLMMSAAYVAYAEARGAEVLLSKTGHSHIEQAMHQHGIRLGGEQSGHFMFGEEYYGYDDAMLAVIRWVSAVQADPDLLPSLTTQWPQMVQRSEKFPVPDDEKFAVMERVQADLGAQYPQANLTDGVRIDWADGEWGIIRCSNTTPKISLRVQGRTEARVAEMMGVFVGAMRAASSLGELRAGR